MIFKNPIVQDGKISTKSVGDRGKRERKQMRDETLARAEVCLHCKKENCPATERCVKEAMRREREC